MVFSRPRFTVNVNISSTATDHNLNSSTPPIATNWQTFQVQDSLDTNVTITSITRADSAAENVVTTTSIIDLVWDIEFSVPVTSLTCSDFVIDTALDSEGVALDFSSPNGILTNFTDGFAQSCTTSVGGNNGIETGKTFRLTAAFNSLAPIADYSRFLNYRGAFRLRLAPDYEIRLPGNIFPLGIDTPTTIETYTIPLTTPTVVSIQRASGQNADTTFYSQTFIVSFSAPITGFDCSDVFIQNDSATRLITLRSTPTTASPPLLANCSISPNVIAGENRFNVRVDLTSGRDPTQTGVNFEDGTAIDSFTGEIHLAFATDAEIRAESVPIDFTRDDSSTDLLDASAISPNPAEHYNLTHGRPFPIRTDRADTAPQTSTTRTLVWDVTFSTYTTLPPAADNFGFVIEDGTTFLAPAYTIIAGATIEAELLPFPINTYRVTATVDATNTDSGNFAAYTGDVRLNFALEGTTADEYPIIGGARSARLSVDAANEFSTQIYTIPAADAPRLLSVERFTNEVTPTGRIRLREDSIQTATHRILVWRLVWSATTDSSSTIGCTSQSVINSGNTPCVGRHAIQRFATRALLDTYIATQTGNETTLPTEPTIPSGQFVQYIAVESPDIVLTTRILTLTIDDSVIQDLTTSELTYHAAPSGQEFIITSITRVDANGFPAPQSAPADRILRWQLTLSAPSLTPILPANFAIGNGVDTLTGITFAVESTGNDIYTITASGGDLDSNDGPFALTLDAPSLASASHRPPRPRF